MFVPRRRTELLVRLALETMVPGRNPVVVDLCCGSGAIGARWPTVPEARVYAADVDPVAVACARAHLPPERVFEGDLYDALPVDLRGRVDVSRSTRRTCRPARSRPCRPRRATTSRGSRSTAAPDGLALHRRVLAEAGHWLAPGGRLVIETSRAQAARTVAAARDAGLVADVVTDDDLDATAVRAVRPQ